MEKFAQGTDVVLDIYFYDKDPASGGSLVDPDGYPATEPTVTVKDQDGVTKVSNAIVSADYDPVTMIGRISQGHYSYKYTLADDAPVGTQWRFIWGGTVNGTVLPESERTEYFEVVEAGYVSFGGYITVAEVREHMEGYGIDSSVLSDSFIQKKITAVVAKVEREVSKSLFGTKSETWVTGGNNGKTIQLPHWPVSSITSIKILYGDIDPSVISEQEYQLNSRLGQISILSSILIDGSYIFRWPGGDNNIEIKYEHGYPIVNADVKDAIMSLIACACMMNVGGRDGGAQSLSVEGYSKNFGTGGKYSGVIMNMKKEAKNTLKSYRSIT